MSIALHTGKNEQNLEEIDITWEDLLILALYD